MPNLNVANQALELLGWHLVMFKQDTPSFQDRVQFNINLAGAPPEPESPFVIDIGEK
jgi:hypothetical protein